MKTLVAAAFALSLTSGFALANGQSLPPKVSETNSEKTACLVCCNHSCNGSSGGRFVLSLPPVDSGPKPALKVAGRGWSGFQGRIRIN